MREYFKWFRSLWKKHPIRMAVVFTFTIVSIAVKTAFPLFLKYVIDYLSSDFQIDEAKHMIWLFLGAALVNEFMSRFLPYLRGTTNMHFAADIRNKYYHKWTRKALSFFKTFRTGDLLTRLTDDVDGNWDRIAWYSCSGIMRPIEAILILSFTLGVMFKYSVPLTLFTFIPLPFLVFILAKYEHKVVTYTQKRQEAISNCNNILEACFSGIRVIKTTLSEKDQIKKYDERVKERVIREKDFLKVNQIIHFFSMLVDHAGSIIVIFVGSYFVMKSMISIGTFLMFIIYLQRLIEPIWTMSWFYASSKQVFRYVDRLEETSDAPDNPVYDHKYSDIGDFENLEFKDVLFKFDDSEHPIIEGISFTVNKSETLAIVGSVGSGKTTLLELIAGNLTPISGHIFLNGIDIRNIEPKELSRILGYIRQENVLFSETIKSNLKLGDEFRTDEIEKNLYISCMTEEIETFPDGLSTELGLKGLSLSGGQKQRLSIARTLIRKPQLLLMDDVTAAMDAKTEGHFWANLEDSNADLTNIVITHRMATSRHADRIIVLENGRIVESGNHDDLIASKGTYFRIITSKDE